MGYCIEVKDFTKKYGKFSAVKDISFNVNKGEIVGFVGKNGAGKSTTIRCMSNMLFPTEGSIRILGMDSIKDAKAIKSEISYMPSETELYERVTSKELFKLAISFNNSNMKEAEELAKYFELDINKRVSELSVGNRKKVSIVLMFLNKGKVLILDEPTAGLDPLMQNNFFNKVKEEAEKGVTVFLSSHNLNEIEKYCTRALIIKDGIIVDDLNMEEIEVAKVQTVSYKTADGKAESYEYEGNVNELVEKLSALDLKFLEIRAKSVEEEFIRYYKGGEVHE
ncbi:MAG: ABC transporter ATP-binding protein [Peptostreptococcaceae bacterium]|nr:ABC transporter ATP-binding protein [Peptostreptococcaceae bacterium]